ncbi:hypothetical protein FAY30_04285 [Bacillus sp. S3]|uniref:hypothetical protein n=1 Tax=Bacillus sp. S3 TaxID=486398 RepID=UPI00118AA553|nr:hypothetical protein [Bacillus sp. S3]QCJ41177.1 hypothetical protein FAY30_04285 [Bacillus sp. S3]
MDEALLHGDIINIETKRLGLEAQNINRKEIINQLNNRYRALSKKRAFTCRCCNEPVNINFTKGEGRPFYFKHYDGKRCSYSENSKTYETQVSLNQDKKKKDLGLTVFKEILEGQLKPIGVVIERGFFYKKKLSFIPDFIVRFPNSKEVWAIDYYTSITEGSYAQNIEKRMSAYDREGFKAYSFIDDVWLAIDPDTNKGTLLTPEMQVTQKNQEDQDWDKLLNEGIPSEFQQIIYELADLPFPVDARSIAYVNIDSRKCKIVRFAEVNRNNRNVTFLNLSEPTIPLEQALTLNTKLAEFLLQSDNEEVLRRAFLDEILDKKGEAERVERAQREVLGKINRREDELEAVLNILRLEAQEHGESITNLKQIHVGDEQIKREMVQRAKEARQRPIYMTPEQWEWYKKTGRRYPSRETGVIRSRLNSTIIQEDNEYVKQQRKRFKDKLLTYPIKGDQFIDGLPSQWRAFILKWINTHQEGESLIVSMAELLRDMKAGGIIFNQKDYYIENLLKEFLLFYQRGLKREMKKKVNIIFVD